MSLICINMQISIPGFIHIVFILMYSIVFLLLFEFCLKKNLSLKCMNSTNNKEIIQIIIQSNNNNRFGLSLHGIGYRNYIETCTKITFFCDGRAIYRPVKSVLQVRPG